MLEESPETAKDDILKFEMYARLKMGGFRLRQLSAARPHQIGAGIKGTESRPSNWPEYRGHPTGDLSPAGCGCAACRRQALSQKSSVRQSTASRYRELVSEYALRKARGSTHKRWVRSTGSNTRRSHRWVNGNNWIPIDDYFKVGSARLFLPSDPAAPLSETANCRCSVQYAEYPFCAEARRVWFQYWDEVNEIRKKAEKLNAEIAALRPNLVQPQVPPAPDDQLAKRYRKVMRAKSRRLFMKRALGFIGYCIEFIVFAARTADEIANVQDENARRAQLLEESAKKLVEALKERREYLPHLERYLAAQCGEKFIPVRERPEQPPISPQ